MADNAQWYVVQTYSGYENTVKTTIEKHVDNRDGLRELIHEICIPMETVTEYTDNGPKEVTRKIFPGYVLVKMELNDETWHVVRNVRGVTGFLGEGNKAIPLSEAEVKALGVETGTGEADMDGQQEREVIVSYKVGDTIRIIDGAMEGSMAVVKEIDLAGNAVEVVVSMFGRELPVELTLDQVESVDF